MTDTDKLQVLYNYIKMIEPNESVYLGNNRIYVDGFGSAYIEVWCKNNKFTARSNDLNPNWLHKVFKVYRVSLSRVQDVIPNNEITIFCDRYYILEPRNEGLFKDD